MEHWQIVVIVAGGLVGFVGFILKMTALQSKSNTDLLHELKIAVDKINDKIVGESACFNKHADINRRASIIEETQKHQRNIFEGHVSALYAETTKLFEETNKNMAQIKEALHNRINDAKAQQAEWISDLRVRNETLDGKITLLDNSVKELGKKLDNK